MDDLAAHMRAELVSTLRAHGALRSDRWSRAFLRVPRHEFLHEFFTSDDGASYSAVGAYDGERWLRLAYADEAWVTQLDADPQAWSRARHRGPVTGAPTGSSSAPGLMARMLEALQVTDDSRVLELGTGTGRLRDLPGRVRRRCALVVCRPLGHLDDGHGLTGDDSSYLELRLQVFQPRTRPEDAAGHHPFPLTRVEVEATRRGRQCQSPGDMGCPERYICGGFNPAYWRPSTGTVAPVRRRRPAGRGVDVGRQHRERVEENPQLTISVTHKATHDFLKALASPTRQRIMLLFSRGAELPVGEVAEQVGLSQSTASQQLALLRRGGIVTSRRDGKIVYDRSDKEGGRPGPHGPPGVPRGLLLTFVPP